MGNSKRSAGASQLPCHVVKKEKAREPRFHFIAQLGARFGGHRYGRAFAGVGGAGSGGAVDGREIGPGR